MMKRRSARIKITAVVTVKATAELVMTISTVIDRMRVIVTAMVMSISVISVIMLRYCKCAEETGYHQESKANCIQVWRLFKFRCKGSCNSAYFITLRRSLSENLSALF